MRRPRRITPCWATCWARSRASKHYLDRCRPSQRLRAAGRRALEADGLGRRRRTRATATSSAAGSASTSAWPAARPRWTAWPPSSRQAGGRGPGDQPGPALVHRRAPEPLRLSGRGALVKAEQARDKSDSGQAAALAATVARPDPGEGEWLANRGPEDQAAVLQGAHGDGQPVSGRAGQPERADRRPSAWPNWRRSTRCRPGLHAQLRRQR
jgi:hypothetical protein